MSDPAPPVIPAEPPSRRGGNWWVFIAVLLAPALVMLFVGKSATAREIVFTLSAITSLFCGLWLARRFLPEQGPVLRTVLGLLLAFAVFMASVVLCCIGCTLGGGEFDMR